MPRILFDQNVPKRLRVRLTGHQVETAFERGWSALSNGDLLREAEQAGFDVLLTSDQNLRYQQNLTGRRIAVVVLGTNIWPILAMDSDKIVRAVDAAVPGGYTFVPFVKPRRGGPA
ncbi:MAG: hypothetical protein AB7F35_12235 [Acetobacteraceae bacterium]